MYCELPGLKRTMVFRNAYSTKSISSFSRLNKSSLMLIIFSRRFASLISPVGFWSSPPSLRSICTAARVNRGDNGKELEHCATPNMKRSDQEFCSKTSWSVVSRLRKAWIFRVQSTVRNKRRVAISYTYSIDNEDTPSVGGFSLKGIFSELRIPSQWSEGWITEEDTAGEHRDCGESELGLVGVRGSKSGFSWWAGYTICLGGERLTPRKWLSFGPSSVGLVMGFLSHCTAKREAITEKIKTSDWHNMDLR